MAQRRWDRALERRLSGGMKKIRLWRAGQVNQGASIVKIIRGKKPAVRKVFWFLGDKLATYGSNPIRQGIIRHNQGENLVLKQEKLPDQGRSIMSQRNHREW